MPHDSATRPASTARFCQQPAQRIWSVAAAHNRTLASLGLTPYPKRAPPGAASRAPQEHRLTALSWHGLLGDNLCDGGVKYASAPEQVRRIAISMPRQGSIRQLKKPIDWASRSPTCRGCSRGTLKSTSGSVERLMRFLVALGRDIDGWPRCDGTGEER